MTVKRKDIDGEGSDMKRLFVELLDAQTQLNEAVNGCWGNFERLERRLAAIGDRLSAIDGRVARVERNVGRSDDFGRMVR